LDVKPNVRTVVSFAVTTVKFRTMITEPTAESSMRVMFMEVCPSRTHSQVQPATSVAASIQYRQFHMAIEIKVLVVSRLFNRLRD